MIKLKSHVCLNRHRVAHDEYLSELTTVPFMVTHFEGDGLVTIHSVPVDARHTWVLMGIDQKLLVDLTQRLITA